MKAHSSLYLFDFNDRYLSLHDNKYIRYFPAHTKKVVTLCTSPVDDMFLSGSLDKTLRLWDLRSPNCQGFMQLNGESTMNGFQGIQIFTPCREAPRIMIYNKMVLKPFYSLQADPWGTSILRV